MKFLEGVMKYLEKEREEVIISRIDYSECGNLAEVYFSNGVSARVRTEKALRESPFFRHIFEN